MSENVIDLYLAEATAARDAHAALGSLGWKDHSPAELRRRVELAHRQDWTCTWCEKPLTPQDIGAVAVSL